MATDENFFTNVYDVVNAYETGFVGAYSNPEAVEALRDQITAAGGIPDGAMACSAYKLEETGKGKLSLPVLEALKLYPDCLPGGAQGRGDCVSWDTRNACLITMCCDITSGVPDPASGRLEGAPEVSDAARLAGVLSTEAIYWWRRHGGDGWSCAEAAQVVLSESGLWLRKKYDEIDVDVTTYSSRTAGLYGAHTPPGSYLDIGKNHRVQTVTEIEEFEVLRDLLANGYGVSSCGGESFSSDKDMNGFSKRTAKGWAHAMAYGGVDDRDIIKKLYGEALVLLLQSWGNWNSGGTRIYGTDIEIPVGAFWVKWSEIKNRYMIAMSGVNGWPPKKLKSYGARGNI
jgi:hypothetical protein